MTIDPSWTVNELLRHEPRAAAVLNRFGVDTCCGGSATLEEAAASIARPTAELLAELERLTVPR